MKTAVDISTHGAHFDSAAAIAAELGDARFPLALREDLCRELGRIQKASRAEHGTATGFKATEVVSLGKAYEAARKLKASSGNEEWRSLRAAWSFAALRA